MMRRLVGVRLGAVVRTTALMAMLCACASNMERADRLVRDGDRLGALEIWRATPSTNPAYADARRRISVVEAEFEQQVTRYKQRARYFEERGQLAESILDYRLALKLQPDDASTLEHVQRMARTLSERKAALRETYHEAFGSRDLATARDLQAELRRLDAFDPSLEPQDRQLQEALRVELTRRLDTGRRHFMSGQAVAAQRAFSEVLEIDPENESALGYLSYIATLRRESERTGGKVAIFDPSLVIFATDAEIRAEGFYQNAVAAERAGDPFAGIRHDERALRANPAHEGAAHHLDLLRLRLWDDVEVLIDDGRRAFREEDLQLALDLWRRALLIDPENERAEAYVDRAERQLENLERLRSEPEDD